MATSKLQLFKSEITPEKNAWVEDMHEYLAKKAVSTYIAEDFQYQKIAANMVITIAADQAKVGDQSLGNYCEIIQDDRSYFFFVLSANWTSTRAVKLSLSMDTINTFGEELVFTDKTTIIREHENRFNAPISSYIGNKQLVRRVDREPEGIILNKYLRGGKKIQDPKGSFNWYLIYKTRDNLTPENTANPIECDLIAENPLLIKRGTGTLPPQEVKPSFFGPGYYYLDPINNPEGVITVSGTEYKLLPDGSPGQSIFRFNSDGNKIYVERLVYVKEGDFYNYSSSAHISAVGVESVIFNQSSVLTYTEAMITGFKDISSLATTKPVTAGKFVDVKTIGIKDIDKTDSKLMKILKLPYCPTEVEIADDIYSFPNEWEFKNGMMRLTTVNLSSEFANNIGEDDITNYFKVNTVVTPLNEKNRKFESKLYNSEFFTYKYVYDSFVKDLKFENFVIQDDYFGDIKVPIEFKPTNTVNSKFAFRISPDYNSDSISYLRNNDYEDFMIVDRNNEETIFSNDYINYIRNGYNYDKKAKSIALAQGIGGIVLGAAQAAATGVAGVRSRHRIMDAWFAGVKAEGRTPSVEEWYAADLKSKAGTSSFLTAGAIKAGFGAVNGIIDTISGQIQAQEAINQKLQQLSNQSTNVRGADDVDLLQYYNGNRLEVKKYEIASLEKDNIYSLFYYAGYNHPVQALPKLDTRYWFNYIQCKPIFNNENTSVYADYLDDIKIRFENGITKFHHHPELETEWNIEQDKENWEKTVLDTDYLPLTKFTDAGILEGTLVLSQSTGSLIWTNKSGSTTDGNAIVLEIEYRGLEGAVPKLRRIRTTLPNQNSIILDRPIKNAPLFIRKVNVYNEKYSSDKKEYEYKQI